MSMVKTENIGFRAPISDAYSVRCLIDFIASTVIDVTMVVTKDAIVIVQSDSYRTILHEMRIDTINLIDYYFNEEYEEIRVGVNMSTLRKRLRLQKKNAVLELFNSVDEPDMFYATIRPSHKNNFPLIMIPAIRRETQPPIEPPVYDSNDPNTRTLVFSVTELSTAAAHISNSKCQYAEFSCFKNGILVIGITNGKPDGVQTLGKCLNPYTDAHANDANGRVLARYNVAYDNIKPFAKINNISPANAVLHVTFHPVRPLRIHFFISTIGVHTVYLTNIQPTTMKP